MAWKISGSTSHKMKNKKEHGKAGKKKKEQVEEYIPIKPIIGEAPDYHVYNMSAFEHFIAFAAGLGIGLLIGYIFFGSIILGIVLGSIAGWKIQSVFEQYFLEKRKQEFVMQFKDLLETLTSSYSAGSNTRTAFSDAVADMVDIYGDNADIVTELQIIVAGMNSNINIEELLNNMALRSGIDDVSSFANVFEISIRQGTNIKDIIFSTRQVINDKIDMEMQIRTLLTANKNELNVMLIMPFVIMLALNGMGDMTIIKNTPINIITKIICIGIFAGAYLFGRKIVNIKL